MAYSRGDEKEIHDKIGYKENEVVFEDDFGRFKFEYLETEDYGDEVWYKGTMYVPDLEFQSGKKLEGRLEGKIIVYTNGQNSLEFEKGGYEIFDYCEGLEYEMDSFIDYVVSELQK